MRHQKIGKAPRALVLAGLTGALAVLGGCESARVGASRNMLPLNVPNVPSGSEMAAAESSFENGNFGFAARYFQMAMQASPDDMEACFGLAASYDWLYRFELSDRTYDACREIGGEGFAYHNNVGFSHLLRGDYARASASFAQARALRPGHPVVETNLEILRDVTST